MDQAFLSTGMESLDRLLGGLRSGDNVVWEMDSGAPVDAFVAGFLRSGQRPASDSSPGSPGAERLGSAVAPAPLKAKGAAAARRGETGGRYLLFVSFNRSPQAILRKHLQDIVTERFILLDCFTSGKGNGDKIFSDFYGSAPSPLAIQPTRPEAVGAEGGETTDVAVTVPPLKAVHVQEAADPDKVREAIEQVESQVGRNTAYVFDSITGMLELWNDERRVLNFFAYMCPRLYDLKTIAYWLLERQAHSEHFLANLRHITQVVIELSVSNGRPMLLLRKAEGRTSPRVGIPQNLRTTNGVVEFSPENREELEVAILSEVSQAMGRAMELEKVFERTMEILAKELRMKRGTLVLLEKATNDLKIVAAHGLSRTEKERGRYKIGEGVTGRVVQTGQAVAVPDISKDPAFLNRTGAREEEKLRGQVSFVCVPLRVDGEVVGAISIDREFVDGQTLAKDQRLLQIIASLVSQAIKINRMVMVEREQLLAENLRLRKDLRLKYKFGNIVAASGAMQDVVAAAATVAKSNATVLIRGETGTGKELIASVLHYNSHRANGPFVKVNCGGLPETLLETELFGHVRGAFTGAVEDRKGRFELAHKGTIFLDEVGSMSRRLQVKLLRVLQEKEFERVGGTETIKVDVRVVAATNADLEQQVEKGAFREDLFYRLNVIPIFIPSLRERREDIAFLVEHFLEKYNSECGKNVSRMSQEVLDALTEYPWPGNVRELESCIERAVVLSQSGTISISLLPINIRSFVQKGKAKEPLGTPEEVISDLVERLRQTRLRLLPTLPQGAKQGERAGTASDLYDRVISQVERALIAQVLEQNDFIQTRAAKELGLSRNTLRAKMKEHGIPAH